MSSCPLPPDQGMKMKGWLKSLLALLRPYRKEDHLNYNMPLQYLRQMNSLASGYPGSSKRQFNVNWSPLMAGSSWTSSGLLGRSVDSCDVECVTDVNTYIPQWQEWSFQRRSRALVQSPWTNLPQALSAQADSHGLPWILFHFTPINQHLAAKSQSVQPTCRRQKTVSGCFSLHEEWESTQQSWIDPPTVPLPSLQLY